MAGIRERREGNSVVSEQARSNDSDDLAFLDSVGSSRRSSGGEVDNSGAPAKRRRRRQKSGRRSSPNHTQVSAWVSKQVRANFDVAQAQEGLRSGKRREFSEIMEALMDFYAREGDPWQILAEEEKR